MILFIEKLTKLHFFLFKALRLFFEECYFVNCIKTFQSDEKIKFLRTQKIYQLDFNSFDTEIIHRYWFILRNKTIPEGIFNNYLKKTRLYRYITEIYLKKNVDVVRKFNISLQYEVRMQLEDFGKGILFLEEFARRNSGSGKRIVFLTFLAEYKYIRKYFKLEKIRIIYIPLGIFLNLLLLAYEIGRYLKCACLVFLKKGFRNRDTVSKKINNGYKVAYFPHQGIYYEPLFIKDEFYDKDITHPLYPGKIVHLGLEEEIDTKTKEYLERFNAKYLLIRNIKYKDRGFLREYGKIIRESLLGVGRCFSLQKIMLKQAQDLLRFDSVIKSFPDLKIILINFEICMNRMISVAAANNNVLTYAIQDRSTDGFETFGQLNMDYYITAGPYTEEFMERYNNSYIKNIIPMGLKRVDQLHCYKDIERTGFEKYLEIKKNKFLVLAFDYHSPESYYEDGQRTIPRLKFIIDFYEALMKLAEKFPNVHIVIKGKFSSCYDFKTINFKIKEMERFSNLTFEYDIEKYNTYKLMPYADCVVAHCCTTAVDEALAFGIPVFIYDNLRFFRNINFLYCDYGVVSENYKDFENKIGKLVNNKQYIMDEGKFKVMRKILFNEPTNGDIQKKIREHIVSLIGSN